MFRETLCSSSGGQIVLIQKSGIVLSVGNHPVCTGRSLTENTIPDAVLTQFDFLMMSTELLETCKGKSVPLQAWSGQRFQEVKVPRFHDNGTGWW